MLAVLALQERFNFTSHAESPPLFYIHFFILRAVKHDEKGTVKNVTLENAIIALASLYIIDERSIWKHEHCLYISDSIF